MIANTAIAETKSRRRIGGAPPYISLVILEQISERWNDWTDLPGKNFLALLQHWSGAIRCPGGGGPYAAARGRPGRAHKGAIFLRPLNSDTVSLAQDLSSCD